MCCSTPAQVELQQGLVCWQQWMRLMRCCVSVCVFWSACTFMYEDWLARNRVLLPSKLFLCLGFIYTRKTRPLTWPNRFVCRPFWLCVCVCCTAIPLSAHPDICESISCLKRKHPPIHLAHTHTHTHIEGKSSTASTPWESVCERRPVCSGGGGVYINGGG